MRKKVLSPLRSHSTASPDNGLCQNKVRLLLMYNFALQSDIFEVFLNPFAKKLQKIAKNVYKLLRMPVISVRYFCLIKDVLCDFVWFTIKSNVHLLYLRDPSSFYLIVCLFYQMDSGWHYNIC